MTDRRPISRRKIFPIAAALTSFAVAPAAARLLPTARQGPGPFYPERLPLDSDADLVQVAGRAIQASGQVTHVFGAVMDPEGRPKVGAAVEIWQCDAFGRYHHPRAPGHGEADPNFQGFGRAITDSEGFYRFRTIKPVPYPGRTPHIHFAVLVPGAPRWTTQMYIAGEPGNANDFLLNRVRDPERRARLIVPLKPAANMEQDALAGRFDIVLAENRG